MLLMYLWEIDSRPQAMAGQRPDGGGRVHQQLDKRVFGLAGVRACQLARREQSHRGDALKSAGSIPT